MRALKKRGCKNNFRGSSDLINGVVILIVLNLMFFILLFIFVARAGSSASFYEQKYSKQIALLIDSGDKGDIVSLKIDDLKPIIERNNVNLNEAFRAENNYVVVKLSKNGEYSFSFLSDYDVSFSNHLSGESLYLDIALT